MRCQWELYREFYFHLAGLWPQLSASEALRTCCSEQLF